MASQYKREEKQLQHKKHYTRFDQYLLCLQYAKLFSGWSNMKWRTRVLTTRRQIKTGKSLQQCVNEDLSKVIWEPRRRTGDSARISLPDSSFIRHWGSFNHYRAMVKGRHSDARPPGFKSHPGSCVQPHNSLTLSVVYCPHQWNRDNYTTWPTGLLQFVQGSQSSAAHVSAVH